MSKRSIRRHHTNRMKAKAKRYNDRINLPNPLTGERWDSYSLLYDHLASCSCWMCGNPRKYMKDSTTFQEKRSLESFKEQLDDIS